jgi:predicted choloylglycine hydrolase
MYRFEGTYRQIGVDYGIMLRANRIRPYDMSKTRLDFARECEPYVREAAPELFEEIDGIAEGSGYDLNRLKISALAPMIHPGCSSVAVSGMHTADGKPLVGRNLDWSYGLLAYSAFCEARPQSAIPSMGTLNAFVGRSDGMNAAGVAVAVHLIEGGRDFPGIMFPLINRIVLDRCHTTEEAVQFLTQIHHARAMSYLVADSSSDIAIVEAAPKRVQVIRPENGFAAITNQFQSDDMQRYEYVRKRPATSYRRLCTLREWFAARRGPITAKDVKDILSAPYPVGVCQMFTGRHKGVGTLWSWTASLGTGSMDFAAGPPGEEFYKTYTLEGTLH